MRELPAVCVQEEAAQGRVSKQSSSFTQAVGNAAEETESTMGDTSETVPAEKKRRKGIDSLLGAYALKSQKQV